MVKVGQIYKYENVGLFVISNIQDIDDEFYNITIIWQEAVNSKEFNDDSRI